MKNNENLLKILKKLEDLERKFQKPNGDISEYISEDFAKRHLGKGTTWFWELRQGGFPYHKIGGQVYYKQKDLVEYIEKNKKGGYNV